MQAPPFWCISSNLNSCSSYPHDQSHYKNASLCLETDKIELLPSSNELHLFSFGTSAIDIPSSIKETLWSTDDLVNREV